jgi:hypothetical protein
MRSDGGRRQRMAQQSFFAKPVDFDHLKEQLRQFPSAPH